MKTRLAIILSLLLIFTAIPASAFATGEDIASGTSGTCDWVIDANGVLTISAGEMGDWGNWAPWYENASSIKSVKTTGTIRLLTGNNMFNYCSSLKTVDAGKFDTSKVKSMTNMFGNCQALTTLDLSSFKTSKVVDMSHMFIDCKSLISIDLSSFDTSKTEDMSGMFRGCKSLISLDLSNFKTSNVHYSVHYEDDDCLGMEYMFEGCESLKYLDVSSFNTSKCSSFSGMFAGCASLEELDLSSFDTSKAEDMSDMFSRCVSLKELILGNWGNDKIENEYATFPVKMYDKSDDYKPYAKDQRIPAVKNHTFVATVTPLKDRQKAKVSAGTVKVLSAEKKTAAFIKAKNKSSVTVPATVTIDGHKVKVTQIDAKAFTGSKIRTVTIGKYIKVIKKNAFKGSKATKLIVKTKLLKKDKVKGSLKGSKVKTIQIKVGKKSLNKKYLKKYKKIFTKKNAGRKVKIQL